MILSAVCMQGCCRHPCDCYLHSPAGSKRLCCMRNIDRLHKCRALQLYSSTSRCIITPPLTPSGRPIVKCFLPPHPPMDINGNCKRPSSPSTLPPASVLSAPPHLCLLLCVLLLCVLSAPTPPTHTPTPHNHCKRPSPPPASPPSTPVLCATAPHPPKK